MPARSKYGLKIIGALNACVGQPIWATSAVLPRIIECPRSALCRPSSGVAVVELKLDTVSGRIGEYQLHERRFGHFAPAKGDALRFQGRFERAQACARERHVIDDGPAVACRSVDSFILDK